MDMQTFTLAARRRAAAALAPPTWAVALAGCLFDSNAPGTV
jgi:hypothetical protein